MEDERKETETEIAQKLELVRVGATFAGKFFMENQDVDVDIVLGAITGVVLEAPDAYSDLVDAIRQGIIDAQDGRVKIPDWL